MDQNVLLASGMELFVFGGDQSVVENVVMEKISENARLLPLLHLFAFGPAIIEYEDWLIEYDNLQFYELFRLTKETFSVLVQVLRKTDSKHILDKPYTGGHQPLSDKMQSLIFLWYMATQDSLVYIANRFKVVRSTVMSVVNRILYFVLRLKEKYIKFPTMEQEFQDVADGFTKYPDVVGAVDGTHIFIKVEKEQQDSYIDRYRRHSINLMAICDSNKLFTYIFVGFPGSAHDSRVFGNSFLVQRIMRFGPTKIFKNERFHLIGDSAFALSSWLMTPYKGLNLSRVQRNHNYLLSSDRVVIEHAFGLLKCRWRRIQYINTYNICKTIEIATAACILHNFCIIEKDLWTEFFFEEPEDRRVWGGEIQDAGRIKRDLIAERLFNL